ncbi:sugar ABC transporter substrate-binding protein [Pseudonocardia sp. K10HN5]|uniref:Sugar ABC transporter substrate-binding protein n=1 Tax=Pseudonocardia acidicola TaxID=2724939 RepID=A0ABX1S784_9PSEU|nr:sugar ABC transporter substrate-binding protein [Pseudonocardia acidicola]NMH96109.1 sugar ABC transporter substrate-binding protein [Pseudonocardia acidicola]
MRALPSAVLAVLALVLSGCAGAGELGGGGAGVTTVTIAIVSNPQMQDAIKLSPQFEAQNPGIRLKFVSLAENEARAKITASVATGGGEFDAVMISNYETPQWARNGWLVNLQPLINATPGYDSQDFIPAVRNALSYDGNMYSVPFYGESSFLMYRKDLLEQAGLTMPAKPTWQQVRDIAARLDDPSKGLAGICLRGKPGWGEILAPFDTVINTFGGRWYDPQWNAQLQSPEVRQAAQFYVDTVRRYGEPGAPTAGFSECATQFSQGNAAMWYDATVAAGLLEDPTESKVVGKVGFAPAPIVAKDNAGWLYSWSLAIPTTSQHVDAAWKFMSWMTSKDYAKLVGAQLGWARVPPGARLSTYQIPEYQQAAAAFAGPTLAAIGSADQQKPTLQPVPYTGIQFLGIPEFQDLGTRVSQQLSAAIAGQQTVDEALAQAQKYAATVGATYQGEGS